MGYQIGNDVVGLNDPELDGLLLRAYTQRIRPLCLCRDPAPEMYIAKVLGKHVLKRMPNSGVQHSTTCDSYEPPAELSGLGEVMGSAIQEDPEQGLTALKLDFSLTKMAGRSAPIPSSHESDSVKADSKKLTLRGTLHYLWEEAGFNRWSPGMAGRRSWPVIRKFILQAAQDKMAKGTSLADVLYIPEPFSLDHKDEIAARRVAQMARASVAVKGARQLMIFIAEVKEVGSARYGMKVLFKHLPDCSFNIPEDLHKRMTKRFANELELWTNEEGTHLLSIGTFSVSPNGYPTIEEISLMCTTANWVPYESSFDKQLIEKMTDGQRRFTKGLRYNLQSSKPLACMVASDTLPIPTAMYVQQAGITDEGKKEQHDLIEQSQLVSWVWDVTQVMPALPEIRREG